MRDEVLYSCALSNGTYLPSPLLPDLRLPKMDAHEMARPPLYEAVRSGWNMNFVGNHERATNDRCPFIEAGSVAIGWDGSVSPCLPLLRTSTSYLQGVERFSRRYVVGNVNERHLSELWNAPEYVAFREKVQSFDFSPCAICDGCPLSVSNEEDCYGNSFPACGGCLWAQGVIQCPL
jgi:MoaA/NifB/PqqE/SkfB family radical SAM enzyme